VVPVVPVLVAEVRGVRRTTGDVGATYGNPVRSARSSSWRRSSGRYSANVVSIPARNTFGSTSTSGCQNPHSQSIASSRSGLVLREVVDPQPEPGLVDVRVSVEEISEVLERVRRAHLVGDDVRVRHDEVAPVRVALHGAAQPRRTVTEVGLEADDAMRRRPRNSTNGGYVDALSTSHTSSCPTDSSQARSWQ
jgi:hypothetical protein